VNEALAVLEPASLGLGATASMVSKAQGRCGGCFLGMCRDGKLDMDFNVFLSGYRGGL